MAENATELLIEMHSAIVCESWARRVVDAASPTREATIEAPPGSRFVLRSIIHNLTPCDRRWAIANTLHFFADTEEAGMLRQYNKHADRFLRDDTWPGAYGAIAMPQITKCIELLELYPETRRAIVDMGGLEHNDANRPACWSFLQFLLSRNGLDLIVYQRSLSLSVFPYDCVLLTNILAHVAETVRLKPGYLRWTIGSLHMKVQYELPESGERIVGEILPRRLLSNKLQCLATLKDAEALELLCKKSTKSG